MDNKQKTYCSFMLAVAMESVIFKDSVTIWSRIKWSKLHMNDTISFKRLVKVAFKVQNY